MRLQLEQPTDINGTSQGHSLRFINSGPTARRPEEQVRFQSLFSKAELATLRDSSDQALAADFIRITP